jgi:glyoxylase-like metal-dependent hydrolase (beta-lactamase superfamily II)
LSIPEYEVFALRYGTRDARSSSHFLGGDPHDAPMPMDYFVWVAKSADQTFVIDTGMTREDAVARKRDFLCCPIDALAELDIKADAVTDVILTHLHYDHAGNFGKLPNATFHLQDREMDYATGRFMGYKKTAHSYDVDDVAGLIRLNFSGKLEFHDGEAQLAPGLSVHRIGGHTPGMQCVRVNTARGVVVLASDTSHFYENFVNYRPYVNVVSQTDMLDGYRTLRRLADSIDHIIPGHDPLVMKKYPAVTTAAKGLAVRLDVKPKNS